MTNIDVAYEQALAADRAARRPDPGTTLRYGTRRKGKVTAATVGDTACEVDGLPAFNETGWNLTVGEVVWLTVDQGRRFVSGVTVIK